MTPEVKAQILRLVVPRYIHEWKVQNMERFFAAALTALSADLTDPVKRREAEVMLGAALAGAVALAPPDSKLHKVLSECVVGLTGLETAIGDKG